MTNRVILVEDPFAGSAKWQTHVVNSHAEFLASRYTRRPSGMVLYHDSIAPQNNVTPTDLAGVQRFNELKGDVYAVNYPGEAGTIGYVIYAIILVAVFVAGKANTSTAINRSRNSSSPSANNDLSDRSNRARPNGRIPDIYGEEISIPDLLMRTYSVYIDHKEREFSYLCIGRGSYDVSEVKDDSTDIIEIEEAGARVFGPDTSPNSGTPQLEVGATIDEPLYSVVRTEAVNGQVLMPPNDDQFTRALQFQYPDRIIRPAGSTIDFTEVFAVSDEIVLEAEFGNGANRPRFGKYDVGLPYTFSPDGTVYNFHFFTISGGTANTVSGVGAFIHLQMDPVTIGGELVNLTGWYNVESDDEAGTCVLRDVDLYNDTWQYLDVGGSDLNPVAEVYSGAGVYPANLGGTYTIAAVAADYIQLDAPGLLNNDWAFTYSPDGIAPDWPSTNTTCSVTIRKGDVPTPWIGPFHIDLQGMRSWIINLVALQGLYSDDGTTQTARSVDVEVEFTPVSSNNIPLGPAILLQRTIVGSALTTGQRALTIRPEELFLSTNRGRWRMRRITPKDTEFDGQIYDEIQWKDLVALAPVLVDHFGDVTTVQTITQATEGALSLKQRKLNMRVKRKVPILVLDDGELLGYRFDPPAASKNMADILAAVCLDPKIGGRLHAEINFVNFKQTANAIEEYFNRKAPRNFSYTFDDDKISFEETVTTIAEACFCTIFRRGNVLNLDFEQLNSGAGLIFNHRNKLPNSEKRTHSFGVEGGYDGIEYEYVDPKDNSPQTIFLPADRSAIKAKVIESVGVRSPVQATLHAWRVWNKMRFQRIAVEFIGTQEASLLARNQKILVANNIRANTQDGEIKAKTGLVVTTSQPVVFEDGSNYVVFLQANDLTTQAIVATPGATQYEITLDEEPDVALSLNPANYALATYILVKDDNASRNALGFLVSEREYNGPMTSKVSAINYDPRYYEADTLYAARIGYYSELPEDTDLRYDDATEEERDAQAFYAEDNGLIPTENDPGYVYADDDPSELE